MTIPEQLGVNLEIIKHLIGHLIIVENIHVPAFVVHFYILHYAYIDDGICFCLEYCGVDPMTEALPAF